jgi:PilZ domain
MATQTGRVEKRIRLEVPMQISRLETPGSTDLPENTTTGNVSAHGVRVLTKRALPPQERLLVTSPISSEEPTRARVVYCQPLAEGVFGVGLQFEKGEARALTESSQPHSVGP